MKQLNRTKIVNNGDGSGLTLVVYNFKEVVQFLWLGVVHKLRWQDEVGSYVDGIGNVNGMQIFPL